MQYDDSLQQSVWRNEKWHKCSGVSVRTKNVEFFYILKLTNNILNEKCKLHNENNIFAFITDLTFRVKQGTHLKDEKYIQHCRKYMSWTVETEELYYTITWEKC